MTQIIKGFSKLSEDEKIKKLTEVYSLPKDFLARLADFRHPSKQELFNDFSENTLTNYYLPFGVAPNFLIDGKFYVVPMVVEESSVVAAASSAASFWAQNGGFHTTIHSTLKKGHIWFSWDGPDSYLSTIPDALKDHLMKATSPVTANMEKRGGGIRQMTMIPLKEKPGIYQLEVLFETVESMGANFINSCLEEMKTPLEEFFVSHAPYSKFPKPGIIMAILSNYTTECMVTSRVECPVSALKPFSADMEPKDFANRFKTAMDIAWYDTARAVTHNKGIFNGTDAVTIATGNDFRAAEGAGHAWASNDGRYRSLSRCRISEDGTFTMELTMPLALGTVGGLTRLHPMAALALEMLGNPTAKELMGITAAAGLANNFSAVASLVTTGIQKGHMKLHLSNLLKALEAKPDEKEAAMNHFSNRTVSARAVEVFLQSRRKANNK